MMTARIGRGCAARSALLQRKGERGPCFLAVNLSRRELSALR